MKKKPTISDIHQRMDILHTYRLKHKPGGIDHDQREHAWNRGMGKGGGGSVTMESYRNTRQTLFDQVRNRSISRKDARIQLAQLRNQITATSGTQNAGALAVRAMPQTFDEAIRELSDNTSYTPEQLGYIQQGTQQIKNILNNPKDNNYSSLKDIVDTLGISNESIDNVATIIQGLFSSSDINYIEHEITPKGYTVMTIDSADLTPTGQVKTEFTRTITTASDKMVITNAGATNKQALSGIRDLGSATLRRQALASMMLHQITGKYIAAKTMALSAGITSRRYTGFHKWPKVAYVFPLDKYEYIINMFGFNSLNNIDLMQEQNIDGKYGFELWNDIVDEILHQQSTASEEGVMQYTDLSNPGLQLLIEYGRKSMSKTKEYSNNNTSTKKKREQYEECDMDMNTVDDIWRDIIKQKKEQENNKQ